MLSCAHTRVGGDGTKGLSGGEKRRLSVGVQLLGNPSVCLLDEPTTGLDAFTARHVVETVKALSEKGKTVVLSIHQPRYDVFKLIDDIILLSAGGRPVWAGPAPALMRHLSEAELPCPPLVNPADFVLDVTSVDYRSRDDEERSRDRLRALIERYRESYAEGPVCAANADEEDISSDTARTESFEKPIVFSLPLLLKRSALNLSRQPVLCSARLSQGVFFALILCAFYAPVGDNQNAIQNIIGNLYELTALCFIGMLSCIAQFPTERDVFYREYADGTYSMLAFFISYFLIAIPFVMLCAVIVSVLMTHAIGLLPTADGFILFSAMIFIILFFGECIGVMFCSIFLHIGFSVNITSMCISVFNMMVGFLSPKMPPFFVYAGDLSPVKWASVVLANAVFEGQRFTCSASEESPGGGCPLGTGEEVLQLYNMDYGSTPFSDKRFYLSVTCLLTVAFFLLTFALFRLKAYSISH